MSSGFFPAVPTTDEVAPSPAGMEETGAPPRPTIDGREIDAELVAACRRGDPKAFEALFHATKDYVYGVALHMVRDESLAADVTQEVFLKLLRRIGQFDGRSAFRSWLYRIAVNAALDTVRRRRSPEELEEAAAHLLASRPVVTPEERLAGVDRARAVRAAVARLPAKLRLPLVLRFVAELSYGEIAGALGLRPGTVASRLSRAQRRLARDLAADPEGGRP